MIPRRYLRRLDLLTQACLLARPWPTHPPISELIARRDARAAL